VASIRSCKQLSENLSEVQSRPFSAVLTEDAGLPFSFTVENLSEVQSRPFSVVLTEDAGLPFSFTGPT
jgi:hypothetical protein